jgi:hypothetical protein
MGFDPSLLPLKREEDWRVVGLRSLFSMRRKGDRFLRDDEI